MHDFSLACQKLSTNIIISIPLIPVLIQKLIQAHNIPLNNIEIPHEEEYQTAGRVLFQLAQGITEANSTSGDSMAMQTLRIKSLPQAAVAGLYLTHTLAGVAPSYDVPHTFLPTENKGEVSPSTGYATKGNASTSNTPGTGTLKGSSAAQRARKTRANPQHPISDAMDRVQRSGKRAPTLIRLPGGKIPKAPTLHDFVFADEEIQQALSAPEGQVPSAPTLNDFFQPSPVRNNGASAANTEAKNIKPSVSVIKPPKPHPAKGKTVNAAPAVSAAVSADSPATSIAETSLLGTLAGGVVKPIAGLTVIGGVAMVGTIGLGVNTDVKETGHIKDQGNEPIREPDQKTAKDSPLAQHSPAIPPGRHQAEDIKPPTSQHAGVWNNALTTEQQSQRQQQLVIQCAFNLMANQAGTPVANLNPDYYDQALIYELQTLSGVFSQPVYQRYVLIAGTPVAVRIIVTSNHGVKYEMFQNSHPAMGYALSVNNGQWQVQQELNSPHLSNKLIEVITPEIVDLGLTQARLSAPDDRGLQWTRDQKSYLRIKGNFMRVYQDKHNVNRYRLVTPDGQSALMVHYHKSRFCLPQEMTGQGVEKKAINLKEMNRQRKIINSHLNHAERHLKNGQIIKFFQELYSAYEKHKKFEAGPIRRITTLALDFIDTFIFPKKSILAADDMLVQIEWIRKVALPIQKNESFKENIINKFFRDTPYFYKIISDHILMQPDRDITDKIAKILSNLSITPLPQYAGSRSRYYRMASEGITTVTSINITGNKKFIVDVMRTLDTLSKTVLGYRLIETLKDKEFTIQPPSMSAIEREDDGWFYAKNSAGGAIAFDPANTYIGDASQLEKEPWRQRDPVIGLYHELLHIYYKHHPLTVTSISGKADKKIVGGSAPIEEALITGIDFYDKKTGERYNFSDKKFIQANKGLMMSENNFRREYAIMRGLKYFLIRPYYIKPDAKVTSKNFILSVTQ